MRALRFPLAAQGICPKLRIAGVVILAAWIGIAALYGLLKPIKNGCIMTYMYPIYIPISSMGNAPSGRYGLYLYHEGWRRIDFKEHLKKLSGVPVLFIPGNAGSYKQVRSLAAESDRAFQGGPFENTFYQEAFLQTEGSADMDTVNYEVPNQYTNRLDWFAVDLEGEHSAMDGRILEEHTEYVVYAIHKILEQYKESHDIRQREGAAASGNLPRSVILVGHSMGGFVARAAAIHPHLHKSAVQTILTLSSPHQSPPLALQPSLGHYFAQVNREWKKGYEVQTSSGGNYVSDPLLSQVVVVSISGGYNDYQVRSKLESLDGIVPPTHGFMISSTSMNNVWLSMEHQAILWCNQLVVQVSHTLLSLVDSKTGQPIADTRKRLWMFTRMLQSALAQSFNGMTPTKLSHEIPVLASKGSVAHKPSCPMDWRDDALDRDLYIQTNTVTILAMDGRRRWLDIESLGTNGMSHFVFVTNLAPCSGVRLHLWPEKEKSDSDLPVCQRMVEVTSRMVLVPSGPAPTQLEPGSQTEQAPPTAVLRLGPEDMRGFRFLTISVAPRQTVSGRPPPAVSMAVGQFFNPEEGAMEVSSQSMLLSTYWPKNLLLKEDHPLVYNLSFAMSLGLLPITLSLKTAGCGIKTTGLPDGESGDLDKEKLCKLRCFPPVALAWDSASGLHVFPNLFSETIIVDSSPALWSSSRSSEKTTVMLLVDPHCSYTAGIQVSAHAMASRFLLLYSPQIVGFSFAVIFFALMRQVHEWDHKRAVPPLLTAVEHNLRMPVPFLYLAALPVLTSLFLSFLMVQPFPPVASFTVISLVCYLFANGFIILLVVASKLVFQVMAIIHTSLKSMCQAWERNYCLVFLRWFSKVASSFVCLKAIRILKLNTMLVTILVAITLACFVHPALGLLVLLLSHACCCHSSMSCFVMASRRKESVAEQKNGASHRARHSLTRQDLLSDQNLISEKKTSSALGFPEKSFRETQAEIFNHRHGLLMLHLLSMLMFVPSLAAWFQRIGMGQSFPWFADSALCAGVIFHGILNSRPESSVLLSFPSIMGHELRPRLIYLLAGFYSYLSGLALAPYKVFSPMAAIGYISLALKLSLGNDLRFRTKSHTHRH
ncbi:PREDICTED: GPI inositol-deacylase [Tarenaya hassleriana]|uniref:GPI inositol-deacylase n=1 Tax=Tarenaya hassleriana TaxID=28532 RepID=UPI00053C5C70|nr:PREDICTED: GPI inositol-deacylase [Tarenaya hassleriana]